MSEKQEVEVTEEEAFQAEMKRLSGVDVEKAPAQEDVNEEAEETKDAEPEELKEAETEEAEEPELKEEANDLAKQLEALRQQNEKLQKALDKTNGTYGSQLSNLQQQIQLLTQQRQEKADEVQKQVSAAKLEKLRAGGFEELADLLESDLSNVSAVDMPDIDGLKSEFQKQIESERIAREEELQRRELRLLQREHPDYWDVAGFSVNQNGLVQWNNAAFGNWVAGQDEDTQREIINGNDAYTLADHISAYKQTLTQQPQKKAVNLEKAIQPKGIPSGRNTVLDEEEQAFRDEMKRLMGNV